MAGKVILVGAGCGKGLITLKGLYALHHADLIVYDDLLDKELLDSFSCPKIGVGKRSGQHSTPQEEINALLVENAREGQCVVRLHGGDSFVFGRGGEEVIALQKAGIPYDIIPGVSSAVAVPENLGIPVTHRGTAQSFTVVTGHTANDTEEDYHALAQLKGTTVFLMGLYRIDHICQKLIACGKDPATPASLLSRGCTPQEKRIDATLATIASLAHEAETPAILIIGETAAFNLRKSIPSVTVTGTQPFCNKFCSIYSNARAYPTIETVPNGKKVDWEPYEWLAFTSATAVDLFFAQIPDIRMLGGKKIACIGPSTAERLAQYKIKADLIPSSYDREHMMSALPAGKTFVLGNGTLYDTIIKKVQFTVDTDYIVFGSAMGVRAFFENGNSLGRAKPVCIGPSTTKELVQHTRDYLVAQNYKIKGIIEVIEHETVPQTKNN